MNIVKLNLLDGLRNIDVVVEDEIIATRLRRYMDTDGENLNILCELLMKHGFSTGHGDTMQEVIKELSWQLEEKMPND